MLFNSYSFILVFLPIVLFGYFQLARFDRGVAAGWLAAASLVFYAYWSPVYVVLLLASIAANFCFGMWISDSRRYRKLFLAAAIVANLALLLYYKYANFFVENLNKIAESDFSLGAIVLPLGISFFTFTQIAYLVDTYQGKVRERNPVHYALFVSYFPHLIAGPVLHHKEMMPQFREVSTYRFSFENCAVGLTIFVFGLFKKVVLADSVAPYANVIFEPVSNGVTLTFVEAWLGTIAYALQLYFDFSGYSDMATGLSRLFGIVLPMNFFSPYKARSIVEFWRRWHMTLSRFLRDYLYVPMGGSRMGSTRRYTNLMITMLLGGLWHGASWTYVVWGALHGFYLLVNHAFRSLRGRLFPRLVAAHWIVRTGSVLGWLLTFVCVLVAWVFFRAPTLQSAGSVLLAMSGASGIVLPDQMVRALGETTVARLEPLGFSVGALASFGGVRQLLLTAGLLAIALFAPNTTQLMRNYRPVLSMEKMPGMIGSVVWRPAWIWVGFVALLAVFALLLMRPQSDFLYFQF